MDRLFRRLRFALRTFFSPLSRIPGFVSDFDIRISSFSLLVIATPLHAGLVETFDGTVTSGSLSFDTGFFVVKPSAGPPVRIEPAEVLRAQFTDTLPGDNFLPGVLLRNGARLTGPFGSLTEAQVKFEKRDLTIPGAEIAWVIYQPFAAAAASNAPTGKIGALLPGGDFFEGAIKAADDKTAKLLNPIFGPRTFVADHKDLLALILRDPRPSAALFDVRTKDGALFGVDALTFERTGVTLKHPLYDGVKLAADDLVEIRAGTARYQPLTTRKPARIEAPPSRKMEEVFAVDKTFAGEALDSLGATHGRGFESAVGVAPTWEVPAGFNTLSLRVVVPPNVPPANRLVFAIYADGRPLLRSAPLTSADKPIPLRVTLTNVRAISLRVEAGFPPTATGSGVWLEPVLLRK